MVFGILFFGLVDVFLVLVELVDLLIGFVGLVEFLCVFVFIDWFCR